MHLSLFEEKVANALRTPLWALSLKQSALQETGVLILFKKQEAMLLQKFGTSGTKM